MYFVWTKEKLETVSTHIQNEEYLVLSLLNICIKIYRSFKRHDIRCTCSCMNSAEFWPIVFCCKVFKFNLFLLEKKEIPFSVKLNEKDEYKSPQKEYYWWEWSIDMFLQYELTVLQLWAVIIIEINNNRDVTVCNVTAWKSI